MTEIDHTLKRHYLRNIPFNSFQPHSSTWHELRIYNTSRLELSYRNQIFSARITLQGFFSRVDWSSTVVSLAFRATSDDDRVDHLPPPWSRSVERWFCPPISLTVARSEWIISDREFRVGSSDSPALCDLCLPYITRPNNPTKGCTRQPLALSLYPLSPLSLRPRWPTTPPLCRSVVLALADHSICFN